TATPAAPTSVRLIRSSTLVIRYKGQKILLDPMFSAKGSFPSFAGRAENPTIDLKVPVDEVLDELDFVLVTHTHPDHFDQAASNILDKGIPLFHQPSDEEYFKYELFRNARSILERIVYKGIEIIRVEAQHGEPSM